MRKGLINLLICWFSLTFFSVSVEAAATEFSVTPLDPETGASQSDYFDLLISPGEKKMLQVRINNPNEKEITVKSSFNTSTTNDAGATIYTEKNQDTSLKTDISSFSVLSEEQVTIPANSTKEVSLTIQTPEEPFEGELIGGFYFQAVEEVEKQLSGSGLKSKYAYAIAVRLRETDQVLNPSMKLNHVYIDQKSLQNYIRINLQNQAAVLIKKLDIQAEVYQKGAKEPIYTSKTNNLRMAPNSNFNYGINLDTNYFKAGDYYCKVTGTANGQEFALETDFTIEKEDAAQLNETTIKEQEDDFSWVPLFLLVGIGLVLGSLVIFKIRRDKKYEK